MTDFLRVAYTDDVIAFGTGALRPSRFVVCSLSVRPAAADEDKSRRPLLLRHGRRRSGGHDDQLRTRQVKPQLCPCARDA
jgi:hypothetical protein